MGGVCSLQVREHTSKERLEDWLLMVVRALLCCVVFERVWSLQLTNETPSTDNVLPRPRRPARGHVT